MIHQDFILKYVVVNLLLIGGLVWGLIGLSGFNLVEWLTGFVGLAGLDRVIYTLVGAAVIIFAYKFYEQTFTPPFLEETLVPTGLFAVDTYPDNWNMEYKVKAPQGATHVIYWADEGKGRVAGDLGHTGHKRDTGVRRQWNKVFRRWEDMAASRNTGVARVDFRGKTVLKFRKPDSMRDEDGVGRLCYRWVLGPNKLSKVYCELLA